jgi:hypothetical protein
VVVVDEAGMVGTDDLRQLLTATTGAGVKTVLVGDAHQLAPVKARGGMFAQLCADLLWTQHLSEVWRISPWRRAPARPSKSSRRSTYDGALLLVTCDRRMLQDVQSIGCGWRTVACRDGRRLMSITAMRVGLGSEPSDIRGSAVDEAAEAIVGAAAIG